MGEREGFLDLLTILREDELAWKIARQRTTLRAQQFIDAGVSVAIVAKQLQISPATWYRRRAELAALTGDEADELAATASAVAADDQAEAEARDVR